MAVSRPCLALLALLALSLLGGCVRAMSRRAGDAAQDAALLDGAADRASDAPRRDRRLRDLPPGLFKVSTLQASWSTPNVIRWAWDVQGDPTLFKGFTLITGRSAADVVDRAGSATLWTAAQNPELGRYELNVGEPVLATMTDGHTPATQYFAQLLVDDSGGGQSASPLASTSTAAQGNAEIVIFSEADTKGYSIPDTFVFTTGPGAYQGTHYYRYQAKCGAADCWENLRRQEVQVSTAALPAGAFAQAFCELAIACDGSSSIWSDMWMRFGDVSKTLWHFDAYTIRCDGNYRLYQIPLHVFQSGGSTLQAAEAASGLYELMVAGGQWKNGAVVRADEVRFRW